MNAFFRQTQDYEDAEPSQAKRSALSRDLFHGLTPEQFDSEAQALAKVQAMTRTVRARMKSQLIERLKTPVDQPSWGPDWVKRGERVAGHAQGKPSPMAKMLPFGRKEEIEEENDEGPLNARERSDSEIIARNMEKSRQVAHYRPLYIAASV